MALPGSATECDPRWLHHGKRGEEHAGIVTCWSSPAPRPCAAQQHCKDRVSSRANATPRSFSITATSDAQHDKRELARRWAPSPYIRAFPRGNENRALATSRSHREPLAYYARIFRTGIPEAVSLWLRKRGLEEGLPNSRDVVAGSRRAPRAARGCARPSLRRRRSMARVNAQVFLQVRKPADRRRIQIRGA